MKLVHPFHQLGLIVLSCSIFAQVEGVQAQGSPLLQITAIEASPGNSVTFTFNDAGTGATNFLVEFAPALDDNANWSILTAAVVQSLGAGDYHVQVSDPPATLGFFRVRASGGDVVFATASFNRTAFQVTEGGMVAPTITFSAPYQGIARYTIHGTAMTGDYVSLSGEVYVNGTSATIPVTLLDNQIIGELRYLTLTLQAGPGLQLGAGSATTITIDENDAEWQGSFVADGATLGFALKIEEINGARTARLQSNGSGFFPAAEVAAGLLFTANEFAASVGGIAMPASATLLNEPMILSLFLSAMNGVTNQNVSATQVRGTGTLISAVPNKPFLTTTNFGTFVLLKPPVQPSTNQVELVTAP